MTPRRIVLVDASVYVFRAWHSLPNEFFAADGTPVNAVHGFLRFLLELLEKARPQYIAVAFDESLETSFRNRIYPAYKANREPAPAELKAQFQHCRRLCEALGLRTLVHHEFEADDLIGSALERLRPQQFAGLIVSADKDLSQLLTDADRQWDFARNLSWNAGDLLPRYGVRAEQFADFLGLTGDAVDNIPGVPGIGGKTAAALLRHFGSLDQLLKRVDEVPFLRLRGAAAHAARLRAHREQALLSRELATIARHAPVPGDAQAYARQPADRPALDGLFDSLRIGPMTRRRVLNLADAEPTTA